MKAAVCLALCLACVRTGASQHGITTHDEPPTLAKAARHTVTIRNFAFVPVVLTVARGDTVEWVNQDSFIHTTAADSAAWSSPEIATGHRFLFVARQPGRLPYHCAAHPIMRGEIVVQ
jgi:plastocyanin